MHILEKHATDIGVKVNKPFIYEKFCPLTFDNNYIIICTKNRINLNRYKYLPEVIEIISPYLEQKKIKILHLSPEDQALEGCVNISDKISINQKAYLIKRSLMYVGLDELESQIASSFNKKIVVLHPNFFEQNLKPYWSNDKNCINLNPIYKNKPNFDKYDKFELINSIYPEKIAESILDLLNIKYLEMPNTIFIGKEYSNKTLEVIPDGLLNPEAINIQNIIIRMDYVFNEASLEIFLNYKKCIIFTNKSININILKKYKDNIINIIYYINDDESVEFIDLLKKTGIKYNLISDLSEERVNNLKLKYMDYGIIHKEKDPEIPDIITNEKNDLYFKSSRILASSNGIFYSKYHWENKLNKDLKVPKNLDFFKEIDTLYFYTLKNEN